MTGGEDREDKEDDVFAKVDDLHSFFMRRELPHKKTRAEEIDEILATVRAGKIGARLTLWGLGFIAAVGAAWGSTRGWWK